MIRLATNQKPALRCNFCGLSSMMVAFLVTNEKATKAICDRCVDIAYAGIQEQRGNQQ